MSAIYLVFQVKFNVEFTRQDVNFSWIAYSYKSYMQLSETKRFYFLRAAPVRKRTVETLSISQLSRSGE